MTDADSRIARASGLLLAGAALAFALLAPAPVGAGAPAVIPLPTPDQFPARALNPTTLLGPDRPGEILSHAPGPVADDEVVHVGLGPDGAVRTVTVRQRLTVSGVGDFELNVPGPASDVTGPALQSPQPGLRRGAVVWQGFSPGTKVLDSTVTLDATLERLKLPLRVGVRRDGGQATVSITNTTGVPVPLADATAEPAALAALTSAVHGALAAGQAPVAGGGGIPRALPALSAVRTVPRTVAVPFRVQGQMDGIAFDALLPSAAQPDGRLVLHTPGPGALRFTAASALPDPSVVAPGAALPAVQVTLAQVLRRPQFTHYLGSPVAGPEQTRFDYGPASRVPRRVALLSPERLRPGALAVVVIAAVALIATGAAVWSRS